MEGWQGLRMRLEYYAPLKKGFVLQLKGPNSLPRYMWRNYFPFFLAALHAAQHGLCTSNLVPEV